jgi:hypothetical protein
MSTGALSSGVKRQGREDGHSPPSSAEAKNVRAVPPLPHTPSWNSAYIKHRDNFTLPFIQMINLFIIQSFGVTGQTCMDISEIMNIDFF